MKRFRTGILCLAGLSLTACQDAGDGSIGEAPAADAPVEAITPPPSAAASADRAQQARTTTQASLLSEPNWVVLFAGHDLSSFNQIGDAEWNIVDGYVEADGYTQAYLVTRGHYTDFLLHVEFWPGPGANSGVFIRNENENAIGAEDGYEINIFDTNENPDNRTGAIVNHVPPATATSTEQQWNTYEIRAEGNRIVARLNGTVTAELEDEEHASGPIAFQNNGGLIRFRNIRLRPL